MDLLQVEIRHEAGWAVVVARGQVDVGTAPRLRQELQALASRGEHRIVLDLEQVPYLDSFGLGVVVGAVSRARRAGGALALVVTNDRVLELLELTGLLTVVSVHPSVAAAVDPGAGQ